jgi:hypothetical protein
MHQSNLVAATNEKRLEIETSHGSPDLGTTRRDKNTSTVLGRTQSPLQMRTIARAQQTK